MDIFSHGLYGSIAFGRASRRAFWTAFFFGLAPDLFSFGIFTASHFLESIFTSEKFFGFGKPEIESIPQYVSSLYDITHSFIVFAIVFAIVWVIIKRPFLEMLAWPLHILVDIPTHSSQFFPTPFLWPISDFHIDGKSWGSPEIFFPNVIFLLSIYIWYFLIRPYFRKKRLEQNRL